MKILKEEHLRNLEESKEVVNTHLKNYRDSAFKKFPLLFILLSTFGVVATLYGFEKVIDGIPLFSDNPFLVLFTGVFTLFITGTLFKKLS